VAEDHAILIYLIRHTIGYNWCIWYETQNFKQVVWILRNEKIQLEENLLYMSYKFSKY
jgi:hypothetical protein